MKTSAKSIDLHDAVPPDWYDQGLKRNLFQRFWHSKRFRTVRSMTRPAQGAILDIGCDGCTFTGVLVEKANPSLVAGIDVSGSSLDYSRRKHPEFLLAKADGHQLPFRDKAFSAIFCLEVMEHMEHPEEALREMHRCLRDDGYCIILVPIESLLFRAIWWVWTRFKGKVWVGAHVNHFDVRTLRTMAERSGFTIEEDKRFMLGMLEAMLITKSPPRASQ